MYEYYNKAGERLYTGKGGGEGGKDPNDWTHRLFKDRYVCAQQ